MTAENVPDLPPRVPTPEQMWYVARLDDAVADMVQVVREHVPHCRIPVAGVCVGETADIVASVPRRALEDMMCQMVLREATYKGQTPPYIHRILDAFISGDPLNFEGSYVPDDVRDRIVTAVEEGRIRVRPADEVTS